MSYEEEPRLSDPSSGASEELRALLGAAREDLPSEEALAALAGRLPVSGAAPAAGGVGTAAWVKWGVVGLVVAALGGAGVVRFRGETAVTPTVVATPDEAPKAIVPATPMEAPQVVVKPKPARPKVQRALEPVVEKPAAEPEGDSVEAELALIREGQSALGTDARGALDAAERHAARFPNGTLAQEREVVAIQALVALGRRDEARARADKFAARWPGSAHWRRIEVVLGG